MNHDDDVVFSCVLEELSLLCMNDDGWMDARIEPKKKKE